jgi:hypothetical protein
VQRGRCRTGPHARVLDHKLTGRLTHDRVDEDEALRAIQKIRHREEVALQRPEPDAFDVAQLRAQPADDLTSDAVVTGQRVADADDRKTRPRLGQLPTSTTY